MWKFGVLNQTKFMETSLLQNIKEIGIALASVVMCAYVIKLLVDKVITPLTKEVETSRSSFASYVESNNHQKTELVKDHTKATVEVGHMIATHTKTMEKLVEVLTETHLKK